MTSHWKPFQVHWNGNCQDATSFFREGTFQQSKRPGIVYDFTEFLIGVVLGVLLCVKEALDLLFV